MNEATSLHRTAMEFAEKALVARRARDEVAALALFRRAFELEREAANRIDASLEPSRSVLLRSAASLAIEAGDFEAADSLARSGLVGGPSKALRDEFFELRKSIATRKRDEFEARRRAPEVRRVGDAIVVRPLGRLAPISGEPTPGIDSLGGEDPHGRVILLDLRQTDFLGSADVNWLLTQRKSLVDAGGRLVVCCGEGPVLDVLRMMRLDRLMEIVSSLDQIPETKSESRPKQARMDAE